MLSVVQSSNQYALRARRRGAVETMRQTMRFIEPPRKRTFSIDPLSMSVIHDLRNPLASICTSAEMLTDLDITPDNVKRIGHNIHRAAGQMRALLADLVRLTEGKTNAFEKCNLREILADVCEATAIAAGHQGVDIAIGIPAAMELCLARTRMERVFINLIANALEAMPQGGRIRIAARKAGDCALIEVEDSGPGIPPEIRGRLFEPFVTAAKKEGLGLGLAISRRTVRDHGGDLWIEPAEGARFVMRLPFCGARSALPSDAPVQAAANNRPKLIGNVP